MEEKIKQTVRALNLAFLCVWIVPIALFVAGECEWLPVGLWADDATACFWMETVCILLTAACVPLALKLFNVVLHKKIDTMGFEEALQKYGFWCNVRYALLELVAVVGVLGYYFVMSNTGGLCALISLTASLFCWPSEKRLRMELHIDREGGTDA